MPFHSQDRPPARYRFQHKRTSASRQRPSPALLARQRFRKPCSSKGMIVSRLRSPARASHSPCPVRCERSPFVLNDKFSRSPAETQAPGFFAFKTHLGSALQRLATCLNWQYGSIMAQVERDSVSFVDRVCLIPYGPKYRSMESTPKGLAPGSSAGFKGLQGNVCGSADQSCIQVASV